jgi:hypothetical protein
VTDRLPAPRAGDYAPYYASYVARYLESDILAELARQIDEVEALLRPLDDRAALRRYAPGKWSVKEVVGHLVDTERLFVYRATSIARGDETPLPGMDQDMWLAGGRFDRLALGGLLDEFAHLRRATILFFRHLDPADLARRGTADGKEVTVRAFPFMICGHAGHHLAVLRERYVGGSAAGRSGGTP